MRFLLKTEINFYYWKEWRWIFKLVNREWEKSHQKHSRIFYVLRSQFSFITSAPLSRLIDDSGESTLLFCFEDFPTTPCPLIFSRSYWRAPRKTVNLRELLHFTLAALGSAPQWGHSWPGKVDNWRRPSFAPHPRFQKPAKFFSTSEQERKTGREKRNLKLISSGWRFPENVKMSKTEKNEIPMERRKRELLFFVIVTNLSWNSCFGLRDVDLLKDKVRKCYKQFISLRLLSTERRWQKSWERSRLARRPEKKEYLKYFRFEFLTLQ